jgi:hypothetical protein
MSNKRAKVASKDVESAVVVQEAAPGSPEKKQKLAALLDAVKSRGPAISNVKDCRQGYPVEGTIKGYSVYEMSGMKKTAFMLVDASARVDVDGKPALKKWLPYARSVERYEFLPNANFVLKKNRLGLTRRDNRSAADGV